MIVRSGGVGVGHDVMEAACLLLNPPANLSLVPEVSIAKLSRQVALFPCHHAALDHHYERHQKQHEPQRVDEEGDP